MDAIKRELIMQRWNIVQRELLHERVGAPTPKQEKLIHTLERVRIEEFVAAS